MTYLERLEDFRQRCLTGEMNGPSSGDYQNDSRARNSFLLGAALEMLKEADARLSASRPTAQGGGWLPIETAPKDGTEILLCRALDADGKPINDEAWGIFIQVAAWWGDSPADGEWVVYCSLSSDPRLHFTPTHWMPLPSPPSQAANEGRGACKTCKGSGIVEDFEDRVGYGGTAFKDCPDCQRPKQAEKEGGV